MTTCIYKIFRSLATDATHVAHFKKVLNVRCDNVTWRWLCTSRKAWIDNSRLWTPGEHILFTKNECFWVSSFANGTLWSFELYSDCSKYVGNLRQLKIIANATYFTWFCVKFSDRSVAQSWRGQLLNIISRIYLKSTPSDLNSVEPRVLILFCLNLCIFWPSKCW